MCDLLAQAIFITKYMKHILMGQTWAKLEEAWLLGWEDQLGKLSCALGNILQTFLDNMDKSLDKLDDQMCWECWPADDNNKEFPELSQV
jgi:hypothetical protein